MSEPLNRLRRRLALVLLREEVAGHWEETSVEEWEAAPRDSAAGLAEFYNSVKSWSFDLLWYALLQSAGFNDSETVVIANRVGPGAAGARMLDLGSGVDTTAALFASLGYEVTLAGTLRTSTKTTCRCDGPCNGPDSRRSRSSTALCGSIARIPARESGGSRAGLSRGCVSPARPRGLRWTRRMLARAALFTAHGVLGKKTKLADVNA